MWGFAPSAALVDAERAQAVVEVLVGVVELRDLHDVQTIAIDAMRIVLRQAQQFAIAAHDAASVARAIRSDHDWVKRVWRDALECGPINLKDVQFVAMIFKRSV